MVIDNLRTFRKPAHGNLHYGDIADDSHNHHVVCRLRPFPTGRIGGEEGLKKIYEAVNDFDVYVNNPKGKGKEKLEVLKFKKE